MIALCGVAVVFFFLFSFFLPIQCTMKICHCYDNKKLLIHEVIGIMYQQMI